MRLELIRHDTFQAAPIPWRLQGLVKHPSYERFSSEGRCGYTTDGMFHFFGPDGADEQNLLRWEEVTQWHKFFKIDAAWAIVAEDVFGNQFCIRRDGRREAVKMFSLLTGEFTTIANDFDGFLTDIVIDPEIWKPFRDRYERILGLEGMHFRPFHHLAPKVPLFLGGADADTDFEWIHSIVNVTTTGQLHEKSH